MSGTKVVVIGGGIAGLAAASRLKSPGHVVTVLEASMAVGGKLRTHMVDGLRLDAGAESILARRPEALQLVEHAGRAADVVHPATTGAGVWLDRVIPLPTQQLLGVPSDLKAPDLVALLGDEAIQRMRDEPKIDQLDADVSVGDLVGSQLGQIVVDRMVEPLLGGVSAGRAADISADMAVPGLLEAARRDGSLVKAARRLRTASAKGATTQSVFASVRGGLGTVGESLVTSQDLNVRRGTIAVSINGRPGHWRIATPEGEELTAGSVVVATPGFAAGPLLVDVAPDAAKTASAIDYASVALITMVFDRQKLTSLPKGTGFLVPPVTGRLTKAATFVSQKWRWVRHLAPNRDVLRFSVGRLGDERGLELSDADLTAAVLDEVAELIGVRGAPPATAVTRWNQSLPQYRVGHRARVADARGSLPEGIAVAGAAWDGIGIPACIASGWAAADASITQGTMVR